MNSRTKPIYPWVMNMLNPINILQDKTLLINSIYIYSVIIMAREDIYIYIVSYIVS